MVQQRQGKVFLVGAGPGDPGLLTLRALECLSQADVVIHDQLVLPRILEYAPTHAERICVADLPGCHPERHPYIHQAMIESARCGKCVVRLKGGDPFLFGRGGEEVEVLRQAGIAYEVVPGVTAALAAAAGAGIPLTHRLHASAVALITGHENPIKGQSLLDWPALARFPGTLVIYMGVARLPQLVKQLLEQGKDPQTPSAAIRWASTGEQRTVEAALADLPAVVHAAGIKAPAVVVIGPVVAMRSELSWFERRPLFGKRVLVTRPRPTGSLRNGLPVPSLTLPTRAGLLPTGHCFERQLELLGAVPVLQPLLEIRAPVNWSSVDQAIAQLANYQWLVFTSANGVHAFAHRLLHQGRDLRALGHLRVAVIGSGSAEALRSYHLVPDLVPEVFRSENLAAELKEQVAGQRVLLARADRGRDILLRELATVARVDQIAVYSQATVVELDGTVRERLEGGEIDYVTVTSSNIAKVLGKLLSARAKAQIETGVTKLVSISPVTSAAIREQGLPVAAEAVEHNMAGMLTALVDLNATL